MQKPDTSFSATAQHPILYLDIDGVLLRRISYRGLGGTSLFELAAGAGEFLAWARRRFDVFWLSARTANGDHSKAERAFRHASPSSMQSAELLDLLRNIPAAPWQGAKINGIDIGADFLWIDDDPDSASVNRLAAEGLSARLIQASADEVPDMLKTLPMEIGRRLRHVRAHGFRNNFTPQ